MKFIRILTVLSCILLLTVLSVSAQNEPDFIKRVVGKGEYKLVERKLSREKLKKFSPEELRIVRNTIFARYGYKFASADLRMHFSKFTWYVPNDKNTREIQRGRLFSKEEFENIRMIKKLEDDIKAGKVGPGTGEQHVEKKRGEYWQKDELLSYSRFEALLKKGRNSSDICPLTSYTLAKVDRGRVEYGELLLKRLFLNYFKEKKLCRGIENDPGACDDVNFAFITRNFIEIDNKLGFFRFVRYDEVSGPEKKMLSDVKLSEGFPLVKLGGVDLRKVRSPVDKKYPKGMEGLYYLNISCEKGYEGSVLKQTLILDFIPVNAKQNMPGIFFHR